jgi:hypothetical protein
MRLFPTTKKFINRQVEIKAAEEIINRLAAAKPAAVEGIVYYGPPGSGKSRLLGDIAGRCRTRAFRPSAIDFQRPKIDSQRRYLLQLLAQIEPSPDHPKLRAALKGATDDEALNFFAERAEQFLKKQPLILLLDSCEFCQPALFDWIGQTFLPYLATNLLLNSIGLFLASRGHQVAASNWPSQYAKSMQSCYVPAFDFAGTVEHITAVDKKKNARGGEKPLYEMSVGHPLSTEALVHFLQRLEIKLETLPQKPPQLAQLLYEEVLQKYLLPPAASWPHGNFEMLCIPRRFDAAMLEKFDAQYLLPWYSTRMEEMQKAHLRLIHADRGTPAYQLDATLRKLLHAALSILRPERVLEINQKALEFYENELQQEVSHGRPRAATLVEMFYHQMQIELLSGHTANPTAEEWLKAQLLAYFKPEQRDDILQIELLRSLLGADTDFIECLGRPVIDRLLAMIAAFVSSSSARETFHLAIRHNPLTEYQVTWFFEKTPLSPSQTVHSEIKYSIQNWKDQPEECGRVAAATYLPLAVKNIFTQNRNCAIELTTNTMDIPFELMHDGEEFLCLAHPFGRHIESMKAGSPVPPLPAEPREALVVGDPTGDLPAAKNEAEALATLLESHHFQVKRLIGRSQATLENFVGALILKKYHLIHYAGHAFFNRTHPSLSGLRLAKNGQVATVTAGELKRYITYPAFVFFNACEAAAAEKETTRIDAQGSLIENLAVAALEGGACGCLGPMWEIIDHTANPFAMTFYQTLLSGKSTGEAVQLARKHIRHSSIDWAAWVLFGNPHTHPLGAAPK